MSNEKQNYTNETKDGRRVYTKPPVIYAFYTSEISLTIVGTLLNLWFLVAILTSRQMRSRLRNKIICNTLLFHLLDSAVVFPLHFATAMNGTWLECAIHAAILNLGFIQDFIVTWLLVMLLVVFIAQIQDFNPVMRLSPSAVTLGTFWLIFFPWVASLIVVPIFLHEYYYPSEKGRYYCYAQNYDAFAIITIIDTAVPLILSVLLLIAAAVLRYRRFIRNHLSGSMQAQLISPRQEIDNIIAYVAAIVVSIICDLLRLIVFTNANTFRDGSHRWRNLSLISLIMCDSRVVLLPLPWLILHDVKDRIKTWRPWYRPAPGIDLTMTSKEDEATNKY